MKASFCVYNLHLEIYFCVKFEFVIIFPFDWFISSFSDSGLQSLAFNVWTSLKSAIFDARSVTYGIPIEP